MNKGKVLLIVGVVLALIGLAMIVYAILPASQTSSATILNGQGYYVRVEIGGLMNGHISGSYSVDAGTVDFYILDKTNMNNYHNGGSYVPIQSSAGSSGDFALDLPDSGQYYLVFDHGLASQGIDQVVTVTLKTTGTSIMGLIVGVALLVVGAILALVGVMMRKKEPVAQKMQGPTDVVMLGQQTPPPPPTQ